MKVSNSLVKSEKKSFSAVITGDGAQKLIKASLRDDGAVKRFTGTLISAVNASPQLRDCDPGSIISAALRGEGAGLIYGQGYYVVPFGKSASFLTSYKGWLQLAIATGLYADIDVIDVKEGERKGRDKRTGKPIVDMSVYDTDAERDAHPTIGWKGYFQLRDGFYKEEYWTVDQVLRHADRYSKAFSRDLYLKWQSGEALTKEEMNTVTNGSPWYNSFDRMARKTVLRSLLTSGFAPLSNEVKSLLNAEPESGEAVIPDFGDDVIPDYSVIESTGEVVESPQEAVEAPQEAFVVETVQDTAEEQKPRKRGRKPAQKEELEAADDSEADSAEHGADYDDVMASFFDDEE